MDARWARAALLGLVGWWVAGALAPATGDLAAIERVLDLHLLVIAPLLLGLDPRQRGAALVLPAALLAVASDHLPDGAAVGLAVPWLALALGLLALHARRLLREARTPALLLDAAARAFLVVGAGWIVACRAGVTLPGLAPEQLRLAAIHSHYTGFSVLALAAASARRRAAADGWPLVAAGAGLAAGFLLVANGIAFAHALEPVGAAVLAVSLAALAGLDLAGPRPSPLARALRLASFTALAVGLGVAITYSLRGLGLTRLPRARMIQLHGWTFALGFVLLGTLAQALAARARRAPPDEAPPLLLFDGVCGLCDKTVQTLLRLDPEGTLQFAPLQGPTADPILTRHGITRRDDFDSILLVRDPGGPREQVLIEFAGARAVLESLANPRHQGLGRLLRLVPPWLGDAGYRLVARNRHRIWGRLDACRVPTPAERARVRD